MTKKDLLEQLASFPDDAEVMVYDEHFEGEEPVDYVSAKPYFDGQPNGKIYICFWAM